jgi:hypothetical protein
VKKAKMKNHFKINHNVYTYTKVINKKINPKIDENNLNIKYIPV